MPGPFRVRWRAAVDDASLAARCGRIVQGIAETLRNLRSGERAQPEEHSSVLGASALFFDYYLRGTGDRRFEDHCSWLLDQAADALSHEAALPSLHGGYSGVGFVFQQVAAAEGPTSSSADEDPCGEIDASLSEVLAVPGWSGSYDLVGGLAGFGLYFLERLPRPAACRGLLKIERLLADMAERSADGCTWRSPSSTLPEGQRAFAPNGYHNFGMAHGVPAPLVLLALMQQNGVGSPRGQEVLREGLRWLKGRRLTPDARFAYPQWVVPGQPPPAGSRFAWCYGDPGPAMALVHAGRALGEPEVEQEGLELLIRGSAADDRDLGIADAPLCHGATGLLTVFLRAWNLTGDARLLPGINRWLDSAISFYDPSRWPGGFASWVPLKSGPLDRGTTGWVPRYSFLNGLPGIGLALLAAISDVEPRWDRLLALS